MKFVYNPIEHKLELWSGTVKLSEFGPTTYELRHAILANSAWNQDTAGVIEAYNTALIRIVNQTPDNESKVTE